MTTSRRAQANQANALLSTGPRTPAGLARSAQNSLKAGLFSRHLVLAALGETEEECDAFRAAVIADLSSVGILEAELADRVAQILWKLRRVSRYETAAQAASLGSLPLHPDQVTPDNGHPYYLPLPPDAPVADRLARVRGVLRSASGTLQTSHAAVAALDAALIKKPTGEGKSPPPVGATHVLHVLDTAATALGWVVKDEVEPTNPWIPVLEALGFKRSDPYRITWTANRLRRILKAAARTAGRTFADLAEAVHGRLGAEIGDYERVIQERKEEEARLAAELIRERETAVAARIYADAGMIDRVTRAESHLSRELDRTLAMLVRLRLNRGVGCTCESDMGQIGFVLQNAGPRGSPTPAIRVAERGSEDCGALHNRDKAVCAGTTPH